MNKILFEGKKIKPESIEKIWREKMKLRPFSMERSSL
jgi:hypothetical protein